MHLQLRLLLVLLSLVLVACGGSPTPNNPNNPNNPNTPNDPNNPEACAVTLTEDIRVSSIMVNSSSECDYLISPSQSDAGYRIIAMTNGTLTIEPGTVIRFAEGGGLRIADNASLQAVGTANARIRFEGTAPIKGYGIGLFLEAESLESTIAYADFAYLGREDTGVWEFWNGALSGLQGGGLRLTDTTIMGSNYYGAELNNLPLLEFSNNTFYDNARAGVAVTARQVPLLDADSDYLGESKTNSEPFIVVSGLFSEDKVIEDATWQPRNAPYLVDDALYVEGAQLTLEAGVRIVFDESGSMSVRDGGTLTAIGTATNRVVFTGREEVAGYWDQIIFTDASPNSRLEHVEVSYGGQDGIYAGNIFVALGDSLYVANSIISNSASWGICADPGANLDLGPGNIFENNDLEDVNTACD